MNLTLFYSWQSDRPFDLCNNFIAVALSEAAAQLDPDGIDLEIDSGTDGVAGMPPITATILDKIRNCDIFLGDASFVAQTEGGKLIPNPNVMAEYGFALNAKGHGQILLVMNEAFGPADDLPFDLRSQRFPLRYTASAAITDGDRRQLRSKLARSLVSAIKLIARDIKAATTTGIDTWGNLHQAIIDRRMNLFRGGDVPSIVSKPRLLLHYAPVALLDRPELDPKKINRLVDIFRPPGFQLSRTYVSETLWSIFDPPKPRPDRANSEGQWSFTVLRTGLLELGVTLGVAEDDDARVLMHGKRIEAWIVRMSEALSSFAAEAGLDGDALVAAHLEGFEDVDVLAGRGGSIRIDRPSIFLDAARISQSADPLGTQLRKMLDSMWLAFGRGEGSPSFGSNVWDGYGSGDEYQID